MNYLYAAYIVTWVILIAYILSLSRRASQAMEDVREIEKR